MNFNYRTLFGALVGLDGSPYRCAATLYHNLASHFIVTIGWENHIKGTKRYGSMVAFAEDVLRMAPESAIDLFNLKGESLVQNFSNHADGVTPIRVGDVINFNYKALRTDGTNGQSTTPSAVADDTSLVDVASNAGVGGFGSIVTFKAPGTATITVSGFNEQSLPFSTQYQVTSAAVPPNPTDHFEITEVN